MDELIYGVLGTLIGGSSIWMFTINSTRQKARAEAMKEVQDVYQETISDLREDKKILKEEKFECDAKNELRFKQLQDKIIFIETELESIKGLYKKERCLDFICQKRTQ